MQNPKDDVLYAPVEWVDHSEGYTDIRFHKSTDGIAKITINRPEVRNAFRPQTVKEMIHAFSNARFDEKIGVIVLTGEGEKAFCSGGDQKIRGDYGGYKDESGVHHLNVLDFQRDIRTCPKPAREIWFLCRQYNAQEALDMGLVNTVVPYADLEKETVRWCREMLRNSPIALRCLKAALNADCDGQSGLQELAGNATMLFYMTEEGQEGRNAFNEKRAPDFSKFRRNP